jgi:hypothetical protein
MKTNLFPSGDDGAELAAAEKAFLESLSTDAPPNGFRLFCILDRGGGTFSYNCTIQPSRSSSADRSRLLRGGLFLAHRPVNALAIAYSAIAWRWMRATG